MAKNTGKLHVERFVAAVAAQEDATAEALVPLLGDADRVLLHEMAVSEDLDRAWWGIRALEGVGNEESIAILRRRLHDPVADLRAVAAMALGTLHERHPAAVNPALDRLAALLGDDNGQVRQAAVTGLSLCGDDAVPVLADALESEAEGVRVRAATALHHIGTMATAPSLYHHLDDPNPLVRHYAYETLDRLGLLENILLGRD